MSTQASFVIAERYAKALFALASAQSQLDVVESDFAAIGAMLAENEELARFAHSPLISNEAKASAFDAILEKARAGSLTRQFIQRLALNRRLDALGAVAARFTVLMNEKRGEAVADIVSAKPLGDADLRALEAALSKALARKVKSHASVDPGLLGGVVIRVAGQMIDYSLGSQLARLEKQLKTSVTV